MKKIILIILILILGIAAAFPIGIGYIIQLQMEQMIAQVPPVVKIDMVYNLGYLDSKYNIISNIICIIPFLFSILLTLVLIYITICESIVDYKEGKKK